MTMQYTNHQRVLKLIGDLGQHPENAFNIALTFVIKELKALTAEDKLKLLPSALLKKLRDALPGSSKDANLKEALEPSGILSSVENLKKTTGVVIVGEQEAANAGVSIPEKYSEQALLAKDPYDPSKTMAQSYGLGFDAETKSWLLVRLSVIPGSLGLNRDKRMALPQHEVAGLKTSIPSTGSESRACYRVMGAIVKSGQVNPLPLKNVFAATDWESVSGCRFIFGDFANGVDNYDYNDRFDESNVGAFSLAN